MTPFLLEPRGDTPVTAMLLRRLLWHMSQRGVSVGVVFMADGHVKMFAVTHVAVTGVSRPVSAGLVPFHIKGRLNATTADV